MLSYTEALQYLESLIYRGIDCATPPMLDKQRPTRMLHLLKLLDNPQQKYPTIHVAGTKGKGSVCAMLASILAASGLKVGLLTSPHLQDIRERIRLNQTLISENDFSRLIEHIQPALEIIHDARFPEAVTATAFQYFAEQKVDIAIIEVGVGGLYDVTNVITPIVSVINLIGHDHMRMLGHTLGEIAAQKGGIIKPNVPVVSAPQPLAALQVLEQIAADHSSPFTLLGRDFHYKPHPPSINGQALTVWDKDGTPRIYQTALLGKHQADNTALALATLDVLATRWSHGITLTPSIIQEGLSKVRWAGRLEVVETDPNFILDGAHNLESAQVLLANLAELFPERPLVMIYASKHNKDSMTFLREMLPQVDHLILTQTANGTTLQVDELEQKVSELTIDIPRHRAASLADAIALARKLAGAEGTICLTGSLFLVGEARTLLKL